MDDKYLLKWYLINPGWGFLPLLVFVFLDNFISPQFAFACGIFTNIIGVGIFSFLFRNTVQQFMLYLTGLVLLCYAIVIYFPISSQLTGYSALVVEMIWLILLTALIPFRPAILSRFVERTDGVYSVNLRNSVKEFLFVSTILRPLLTIHLMITFAYHLVVDNKEMGITETILDKEMFIIICLGIFIYEMIRLKFISDKLRNETWLPVVDVKGKVIGRIARSESLSRHAAKYTHPLVRCVVMHKGMLYLKERKHGLHSELKKIDIPFFKLLVFRQTIEQALQKLIGSKFKQYGEEPRFLLQYLFDNGKAKNLVSLYLINVKSEALAAELGRDLGKLWTVRQIDENIDAGIFSEYFEQEYVYLKNTVLLAESLRNLDVAER
ncbi:MAG: hypothetical protein ACRDCN_13830 [Tannerellaceae bacterium]